MLAACKKLKGPPIAIVYGVPSVSKRQEQQALVEPLFEKSMEELDGFLESNSFKTRLIAFNEYKSTQISSVVIQSLTRAKHLGKRVILS